MSSMIHAKSYAVALTVFIASFSTHTAMAALGGAIPGGAIISAAVSGRFTMSGNETSFEYVRQKTARYDKDPYVEDKVRVFLGTTDLSGIRSIQSDFTGSEALAAESETGASLSFRPGKVKPVRVRLERTLGNSKELHAWFQSVSTGKGERQSISVISYDREGKETRRFEMQECLPVRWSSPEKLNPKDPPSEVLDLECNSMISKAQYGGGAQETVVFRPVRGEVK